MNALTHGGCSSQSQPGCVPSATTSDVQPSAALSLVERLRAHVTYEYMPRMAREAMDEAAARIEHLEAAMSQIALGTTPSERDGHYVAHRNAVKLARKAMSTRPKDGTADRPDKPREEQQNPPTGEA